MADPEASDSTEERDSRRFLKLRLRYDPYSATAEDDYERLAEGIAQFDVVGMLARELRKTRVDERLVKQLVKSLKFLDESVRDDAAISLVRNLEVLYPVFPTVARVLKSLLPELSTTAQEEVFNAFRRLITERSYVALVPTNLAYAVRVIALDPTDDADNGSRGHLCRGTRERAGEARCHPRDGQEKGNVLALDLAKKFATLSLWERRALIVASYVIGDEGNYWRKNSLPRLAPQDVEPPKDAADTTPKATLVEIAFWKWVISKNNGRQWEIPL